MTAHEPAGACPLDKTDAVEAYLTGRVQGVGYRYFAFEAARRLGLVGYVRNTRDGGVRVYAEGPREKLQRFLGILEQGPQGSRVQEMRVRWGSSTGSYLSFGIEPTL